MKETCKPDILLLFSATLEKSFCGIFGQVICPIFLELNEGIHFDVNSICWVIRWHNNKCMKEPKRINTTRDNEMPVIVASIF